MESAWRLRRATFPVALAEATSLSGGRAVRSKSGETERSLSVWRRIFRFSYTKVLIVLFVLSLPVVNPWVHGDGVGYYAYAHSLLIDHNLQFENEWQAANSSFTMGRVGPNGEVLADQYTLTHHLDNHFSVGPSLMWAPFLILTHFVILMLNSFGAHFSANGFSRPYLLTMGLATAGYGFAGLLLSFRLACRYTAERWAFLATAAYWFASSLPVYMYLNPSWSHAHSLFTGALFLWYWHRTRGSRSRGQWILLGLISALMVNVYYINAILLLIPAFEALTDYREALKQRRNTGNSVGQLFGSHILFVIFFLVGMLPTLATRKIIYGGFLSTGYPDAREWAWRHPLFWSVLFSSDHGLLSWTPILILALIGLVLFRRYDGKFALFIWAVFLTFYYVISCYYNWDGLSSFGNRFFISLGPMFILGLAVFFERVGQWWRNSRAAFASLALASILLVAWNIGFIFQWGDHLIPVRGPISWRDMAYNQFRVVPIKVWETAEAYFFARKRLLHQIEQKDMQELKKESQGNPEQ